MSDEEFDFNKDDLPDVQKIALEQMAKISAQMYRSFKAEGLDTREAAALTAAYWAYNMTEPEGPVDGS